jgi:hypothetical protein
MLLQKKEEKPVAANIAKTGRVTTEKVCGTADQKIFSKMREEREQTRGTIVIKAAR